jgi:hypothetical protein
MLAWAKESAPLVNAELETQQLRDHTFNRAISDWAGAWRNWIRRAQKFAEEKLDTRGRRPGGGAGSAMYDGADHV